MEDGLREELSQLADRGVFGPRRLVSVIPDPEVEHRTAMASEVAFLRMELAGNDSSTNYLRVIVKRQMGNEETRIVRDMATMFYNEVAMYRDVLPLLGRVNTPKMYFGRATLGDYDKDLIILDNISRFGYVPCEHLFLDFKHIALSMKKIAHFHALSYISKHNNPKNFENIKNKLKPHIKTVSKNFDFPTANYLCMKRGIDPINQDVEILKEFLKIIRPVYEIEHFLFQPVEPFSVILHGDFCTNNCYYKYQDGAPVDCMFFDLQLSKYASPVIDLSFFLYMHTTPQIRESWDDFLKIYWDTVQEEVEREAKPGILPDLDSFLEHFATKAVYGFIHASFFIPMMMDPPSPVDLTKMTNEQRIQRCLDNAGEDGERICREIAAHLFEKKYIHKFVEDYKRSNT